MTRAWATLRDGCTLVGFTLISLLLVLASLELGTRAFFSVPVTSKEIVAENASSAYHPWADHRMTPGFTFKCMSINRYGWRGPEFPQHKASGVKRVILLGDSVAFSSFHICDDVTIAGYLQKFLAEKTGEPWEVINMAVPGGNGRIALATLAHEGIHFEPDVVVALNGNNDLVVLRGDGPIGHPPFMTIPWHQTQVELQQLYDPRTGRGSPMQNLLILLNESAFFRQLGQHMAAAVRPQVPWEIKDPNQLKYFVETQVAISYLAKGAGARFVHFVQPYLSVSHKKIGPQERAVIAKLEAARGQSYLAFLDRAYPLLRDMMAEAARTHGFRSVDLTQLFTDGDVFADQSHFRDETGNERVAGRMAEEILIALQDSAGEGAHR